MSTESLVARMRDEYVSEDLIRDVATALTDATASLDARWEHSDHLTAKYYQRMRAAEREMHARELHHFEEEKLRAEVEARLREAEACIADVLDELERLEAECVDVPSKKFFRAALTAALGTNHNEQEQGR